MENILALFIKQLCYKLDEIPQRLLAFYKEFDETSRTPTKIQYVSELKFLIKSYPEVYIFVDALDEFDPSVRDSENRKYFINILQELANYHSSIKVFITSRRESDIESALSMHQTPVIKMEAKDIGKDIETFIRGRIEEWVKDSNSYCPGPKLREKILLKLVEQANGMYV